jgi:hypothetical protein
LFFLLLGLGLRGQSSIGVADLFDRVPELTPLPTFDRSIRTPLVGSYDLRTESEDFDPTRQEYTLRLNTVTLRRARAQRRYAELLSNPVTEARDKEYCELVERTYRDWPTLYLTVWRQRVLDTLTQLLDDRSRLAKTYAEAGLAEAREQFRIRTDRTDLLLDLEELRLRERTLRTRYDLGDQPVDLATTIGPLGIGRAMLSAGSPDRSDRMRRNYRLSLIDREIEVERAEGKQILDFLQFRYRSDVRDEVFEKFSIGVALRIQDSADRRLKVRELELRRREIEREGSLTDQLLAYRQGEEREELKQQLERYERQVELYRQEAADLARLTGALTRERSVNPELLLDIRERALRNHLRLLNTLEEVYDEYLDWRSARGELCGAPNGRLLIRD